VKKEFQEKIGKSFLALREYCERESFKGWDPYDGLNSRIFQKLFILNRNSLVRLAWIQAFKKNPVNLRKIFLVYKDYNPKGLGLFLNGYCNLYRTDQRQEYLDHINFLAGKIISMQTKGFSGSCWGYNFDWQSRAFFQPKYTPTVVASTFIGYALLDAYDITGNELYRDTALSVCDFILKDLNRTSDEKGHFAFSYSPFDNTRVYNASLLGSRMLSRAYSYRKDHEYIVQAKKSVAYCCEQQKEDGSWAYSPLPFHQWIDNFHTGFNLECISEYEKFSNDNTFRGNIGKGLDFYMQNFFLPSGVPKYYNNSVYPVDIHAPAQMIITLHRMGLSDLYSGHVEKVLNWTIDNMQSRNGYFFYQKNKYYINRIPYIRWSQAWMFFALSFCIMNQRIPLTEHQDIN